MNIVNNFDEWLKLFLDKNEINTKDTNSIISNVIKQIENNGDKFKYIKSIAQNKKSTNKQKYIYENILSVLNEYEKEFKLKETKLNEISPDKYYSKREISIFANDYREQRGILVDKNENSEKNIVRNIFAISSNDDRHKDKFEKNGIIYFSPLIQKNSRKPCWDHACNKELMKINSPNINASIYFFRKKKDGKYSFMGKYYFFDKDTNSMSMILKPLDTSFNTFSKDELIEASKNLNELKNEVEKLNLEDFSINRHAYNKYRSLFRNELILKRGVKCEINNCRIDVKELMRASHIKPVNEIIQDNLLTDVQKRNEIIDPNNGFLFCPNHDLLFDRFLITFNKDGQLIVSNYIKAKINYFDLKIGDKLISLSNEDVIKYLNFHNSEFNKKEKENN